MTLHDALEAYRQQMHDAYNDIAAIYARDLVYRDLHEAEVTHSIDEQIKDALAPQTED